MKANMKANMTSGKTKRSVRNSVIIGVLFFGRLPHAPPEYQGLIFGLYLCIQRSPNNRAAFGSLVVDPKKKQCDSALDLQRFHVSTVTWMID